MSAQGYIEIWSLRCGHMICPSGYSPRLTTPDLIEGSTGCLLSYQEKIEYENVKENTALQDKLPLGHCLLTAP